MYAVERLSSYITRGVYTVSGPFHPFGGAVDIIVVQQQDGSFKSSPWYVKFGKFQGVLKTKEKVVNVSVNGMEADFHMYLDHTGEAYFLKEMDEDPEGSITLTSLSSGDEIDEQSNNGKKKKSKICDFDVNQPASGAQMNVGSGQIVVRTNSRRSRILAFVFGQKSMKKNSTESEGGDDGVARASSLERAEIAADLLEVKWSTNLPTGRPRKDNSSTLSALDTLPQETDRDLQVSDAAVDQGVEMVDFSNGKCEEAVVQANFICEETELNSEPESDAYMAKENVDGGSMGDSDSKEFSKTESLHESKEISADTDKGSIIREPLSSLNMNAINSDPVEAEILGDANQENITEGVVVEKGLETETLDAPWNQSQMVDLLHSCTSGTSELHLEEPVKAAGSVVQVLNNVVVGLTQERESQDVCVSSSLNNFIHPVEGEETLGEGNERNKLHTSGFFGDFHGLSTNNLPGEVVNSSRSPSEISEENQFLFSDIKDFVPQTMQLKDSSSSNVLETEKHLLVAQDEILRSNDTNDSSTSSLKLVHECFPVAFEPQPEESKNTFSSLSIPRSGNGSVKEIGPRIGSLPNFQSCMGNFEMSDIAQPLSHSLDSGFESMKLGVLNNSLSSSTKSNLDTEHRSMEEGPTFEEIQFFKEFINLLTTNKVEISLCKHLLYEGMGTDAASQAFDAERVDLEKFLYLGPAFVKNDRLIVRIDGHYFTWDAAEPVILGMFSCNQQQSSQPEGTMPMNGIVETLVVDSSRAIDTSARSSSGGSWRLWPFKTSRSMNSVKPAPDGAEVSEVRSVSESTGDVTEDKTELRVNVSKKKLKSIVPTSKQIASLNLKEGQNIITFTFSTAMLGKQQVDARIYLWKWNTRIVVSDVDGTITRSDVLGQFMPLVGKDWSQTGVAHLFSAIKENGYQLLFLSARAISQAYLTRQFLFNLKQDGKALPDGPVVISPDGLFPSLFREVIRRAPHEFKIACLKDIRALFPPDCNPFYAGFGNRDTDEFSYLKIGIPKGKIFIINAKGEVAVNQRIDRKSYNSYHALVDDMFPAMSSSEQEEFNSWNFWRMPFPEIIT